MDIKIIRNNKKDFLDLLLLGDESEAMIDLYLSMGELFALYDVDLRSICVVTDESGGNFEIKNLATYEKYQNKGYAGRLIEYVCTYYKNLCRNMYVGTGEMMAGFYERHGFTLSHKIENFFIDNYENPIIENGVLLVDMIYLKKEL